MNARIKQLAEQAAKDDSDGYDTTLEYTNKFAENLSNLIIKECIAIVDTWVNEERVADGMDKFTVFRIKQHFGIK